MDDDAVVLETAQPRGEHAARQTWRAVELFGDRVEDLTCRARTLNLDFTGAPEELFELYRTYFGPVLAARAALATAPARLAAFDHDLVELFRNENLEAGTPGRVATSSSTSR